MNYPLHPINQLLSVVQTIAQQCPLAGGIAVIKARAMVYMFDDSTAYNDRAICDAVGITLRQNMPKNHEMITKSFEASLYPNPANGSVTVVYNFKVDCAVQLVLTNSMGQIIKNITLPKEKFTFEFSTLEMQGGIYQYQLKCETVALDRGKLIIVH